MKRHKMCLCTSMQKNRDHNPKTLKMKPWATKNPRIQSPVNPWPCNRQGSECAFTFPNLMTTGFWKALNFYVENPQYIFVGPSHTVGVPFQSPLTTFLYPRHNLLSCIQGNTSQSVRGFASISASEFWSLVHKTEHPQWIKKTYFKIIFFLSGKGVGTV